MTTAVDELQAKGIAARVATRTLAKLSTDVKNKALLNVADALTSRRGEILDANQRDYAEAERNAPTDAMLDRLLMTPERLDSIADDIRNIVSLPDPVGETMDMRTMPNGLQVGRRRVPLGVIGAIYESRPNVTVDISALCLKSGNSVILRGGKEAIETNGAFASMIRDSIGAAGGPKDAVQFIESTDRALVGAMLKMKDVIDLIIPRGGQELVRRVAEEAAMPAITGGIGVCHTYVDRAADLDMAVEIVFNAKVHRPTVCNALDSLIVHSSVALAYLPRIAERWQSAGVQMRCDRRALSMLGPVADGDIVPATERDWGTEFLSLKAAVKVVDSLDEAMEHIEAYGTGHSEAIVTEDYSAAMRFLNEVDSSAVMVNASTRFNDGAQFGLGAEVAISTNKMHARGPMGLRELTSYKWIVVGTGQVRA